VEGRAALEGTRAIGRLEPIGAWVGFGFRDGSARIVVDSGARIRDAAADADLLLALAIAYFTQALDEAPGDLEATQSDMSGLVRHLIDGEAMADRRAMLREALDAIDDGLAGDAVAVRLAAARSPARAQLDPVELLRAAGRELAAAG
jgi:hypothetical protein